MLTIPSLQIRKGKSAYGEKFDRVEILYTDKIIKEYLSERDSSEFGALFKHVNLRLKKYDKSYSRPGFANHLNIMIEDDILGRKPYKQGHYLYFLTKKGKEDIFLKAKEFQNHSEGLLRVHFEGHMPKSEKYFLKRTINRIGFYMLYSCIQGLKNTSIQNSQKENVRLLLKWADETNPASNIYNYLNEMILNLSTNPKDIWTPITKSQYKMNELLRFEKILKKTYPKEYQLCNPKKIEYPEEIQKFRHENDKIKKTFETWIKNLNNQMKKRRKKILKKNECPRCHYNGIGPVKSGPFKGKVSFFKGYMEHGPDKGKWCDLCYYNIDNSETNF